MNPPSQQERQPLSVKKRFLSAPTLLSFGVAVGIIVLLLWRFDLDLGETWQNVRNMNPWLYVLALVAYYMSFAFRGVRWRMLARNSGVGSSEGTQLPSAARCAELILTGWFVNAILWLRLGDAYRAYAFSEDSKASFSGSLGTILAERVLDMALIFSLVTVSVIFLTSKIDSAASNYILVAAFVMAVGLGTLLVVMKRYGIRLARLFPHRFEEAYHQFQQGTLGSFKQLPVVLILGLIAWFLEMARLYLVVQALDLDIGLVLVPIVALGHAILSTVPTPGGVGAVEPGVTGLLLLTLGRNDAVSVAVVDRSITYVSVLIFGGLVFFIGHLLRARRTRLQHVASRQASEHGHLADG